MPHTHDPIRVGLIGYGYAGRTFHAPLLLAVDGLALTVVGSSRPEVVLAAIPGVTVCAPDAVPTHPDIDLVVIATPTRLHQETLRQLLGASQGPPEVPVARLCRCAVLGLRRVIAAAFFRQRRSTAPCQLAPQGQLVRQAAVDVCGTCTRSRSRRQWGVMPETGTRVRWWVCAAAHRQGICEAGGWL